MTGCVPRSNIRNDVRVMVVVAVDKLIPSRPEQVFPTESRHGNVLWSLLERCWSTDPKDRPKTDEVVHMVCMSHPSPSSSQNNKGGQLSLIEQGGLVDEAAATPDTVAVGSLMNIG
jgi:hypothetical protein